MLNKIFVFCTLYITLLPGPKLFNPPNQAINKISFMDSVGSFLLTDSITQTVNMLVARAAHTSTLLNNGQVLICGGFSGSSLAAAELFDPVSKKIIPVARMNNARSGHTATVLTNGKVLIAGGYNGNYLESTELFDPMTRRFTPSARMTTARSGHTATVLNDGNILFAGGVGTGWSFLQSAEIYSIRHGNFFKTGAMSTARESHTATKLKNGTVLITGGHMGRRADIKIYGSAEIYNPSSGKFTPTGNMTRIHHKHDAVLLQDGRVLITGGSDERDSEGTYSFCEIYYPALGVFKSGSRMNLSRYKHNGTSILLDNGNVLVAGGTNRAEIYNPSTEIFTLVPGSMKTKRLFSCATRLNNGNILITGGYNENIESSANTWTYVFTRLE